MSGRGFFAERLKLLRAQAGLSQPMLAEKSGLGVSTIRQFEYGRREPAYSTLVKLAKGLNVSLDAFGEPAEASPPPTPKRPGRRRKRKGE